MPRINYNAPAMLTQNRMSQVDSKYSKAMERISSGMRINAPSDDVAGHNTSEQLRSQIRSLDAAGKNIQDGIALINVTEGALQEVSDMLQRMRELSVQSANETLTNNDRVEIEAEVNKLKEQIDSVSSNLHFNGQFLLDGSAPWGTAPGGVFHIGPNNISNTDFIQYTIPTVNTVSLGIDGSNLLVDTSTNASAALDTLDIAINVVNSVRTDLGAISNRLEHAWTNQSIQQVNMQSFESIIRDADIAEEMTNLTREKILKEYSTAMLSQANMVPQSILKMLD